MTQEEKNKIILDNWDKESLANGWVNEHIKNNQLKEQVGYLQSNWNSLREYIKNNSIYYNTSDGCQWVDQFKLLDKMNELEGKK